MRLRDAAKRFDRTPVVDAYTGQGTFYGQLNLFDDSMRDGTTVVRRVLSLDRDVSIPARRAVTIHGEVFMIGGVHKDSFDGDVLRQKYVVHRADGLAARKTADEAIRAQAGYSLYGARLWVKDLKELEFSSRLPSFMNLYIAPTETAAAGDFILLSSRLHLVRNTFLGAAGFRICEVDELPSDALTTASYVSRTGQTYNPATDTVSGTTTSVPVIQHRWQDDYLYERLSSVTFDAGDHIVRVSKTNIATAEAGDSLTLADGRAFKVVSVKDDGAGAWALHARRD